MAAAHAGPLPAQSQLELASAATAHSFLSAAVQRPIGLLPAGAACHTQAGVRKFNLEGPVEAERHYRIPPLDRVNLDEILELLADRRYFVLHAPRQTGKTALMRRAHLAACT